ncbi:MAG: class I SAM-dependent methyltransferase [Cyclobacteriaceae bacterium]|nr:class I SAM-dependent methyltransferase [Cyclobacteriaceae bacterium]
MFLKLIKSNFPGTVRLLNTLYNHVYHLKFLFKSREAVFKSIYRSNHWSDSESVSGPGSTFERTKSVRAELPRIVSNYKIKSLLDVPCGDFNWMKLVNLTGVKYVGVDIVPELIEKNQFENKEYTFYEADLVSSTLPKVDLIFCRDCLVHLSFENIRTALRNIKRSDSTYLLTTTFTTHKNFDIITGNWRPINLQAAPFVFPEPLLVFQEDETGENQDKSMALWRISDLPV